MEDGLLILYFLPRVSRNTIAADSVQVEYTIQDEVARANEEGAFKGIGRVRTICQAVSYY